MDALLRNASARLEISQGMKAFFAMERSRAVRSKSASKCSTKFLHVRTYSYTRSRAARHVRGALKRSIHAAASARAALGQRSSLFVAGAEAGGGDSW